MKRISLIASLILVVILLINTISFLNVNRRFVSFLNSSLVEQTKLCGSYMENTLSIFESELQQLLFEKKYSEFFSNVEEMDDRKQDLQVFYAKYNQLISDIHIVDDKKNYFGLYINDKNDFVIDTFSSQRQVQLSSRDKVVQKRGIYQYHVPFFKNDFVSGNIVVSVDFDAFAKNVFSFYPLGQTITYQWVLDNKGRILSKELADEFQVESVKAIADSVDVWSSGLIEHSFKGKKNKSFVVHSAYYPLTIFRKNLGIVFSASQGSFNRFFIYQNLLVTLFTLLSTILVILYFVHILNKNRKLQDKLKMSDIVFRKIYEDFPVGLMILDADSRIRNVNAAAQECLLQPASKNLIGEDFYSILKLSKYVDREDFEVAENVRFIQLEKHGNEILLMQQEVFTRIGGEEIKLLAMVDISALEKHRKQEMAANKEKTEFLASMSQEIRTPLNGILAMVSSLNEMKNMEELDEKVEIIEKSSNLLLTIVNDMLDLSKIEVGRMLLDEIPFLLREELNLVLDLFKPLAEEKGLEIELNLPADVPEELIGDPFRLRQVLSNLISNAIKFTKKGRIMISVSLLDKYHSNLQLLFTIEDTGIGISEDRIGKIFSEYSRTDDSESPEIGGSNMGTTISKQLVELMNGEIWVVSPSGISSSQDNPGSCFSFTIEVCSNEKLEKSYNFDSIHKLNQLTVLILTKEAKPDLNIVGKLFYNFGVNIVAKVYQDITIDSIVHHIETHLNRYHLIVITDKKNQDGFTLASHLKTAGLHSKFPIVFVSSDDKPGNYRLAKKNGIDYYLIEPFEEKELFDILKKEYHSLEDHVGLEKSLHTLPDQLNILLVEDNIINQKVAQTIFKNIGYEIDIASNGAEAINMVEAKNYDIVFMDIYMPEMDGFEATKAMRSNGFKAPIIAMSADTNDQKKADSILVGMNEFLSKPAKVQTIKELLIKQFSTSKK